MRKESPEQRRKVILERLLLTGRLELEEIVREFHISVMTANRDIHQLVSEGSAKQVRGGIVLPDEQTDKSCVICQAAVPNRTQFLFIASSGKKSAACCPHCGLTYLSTAVSIKNVFATDFLYGSMINAHEAFYLVDSRVRLCCSPSVLSFQNQTDALAFQAGFGGDIMDLKHAGQLLSSE